MLKKSATCHPMKDLKDMCLMTCVSEFFRKVREWLSSGFLFFGFSLFGFAGTSEARSCEASVEGFPLKLMRLQHFRDH